MELRDCDKGVLNDVDLLRDALLATAREAGATVVAESFHRFDPQGVSGVVIIAESPYFIHTWTEYGYAAADIFTCGDSVSPRKAAELLIGKLRSKNQSMIEIERGIVSP